MPKNVMNDAHRDKKAMKCHLSCEYKSTAVDDDDDDDDDTLP